ncbi:hypothetical protein ACJIZ3_014599 [Penstemon smallii]|uniref:CLAVATA3/ESR (CLE)-related protein 25 n=1 Tax=Penstemon smallii TaxID=265156 RepID=A0ABD3RNG6_9LAMI
MVWSRKLSFSLSFFLFFLVILSLANKWNTNNIPSLHILKLAGNGRRRALYQKYLNLNFVSKRRVPHGPDPIHNRRTENTKLPPT